MSAASRARERARAEKYESGGYREDRIRWYGRNPVTGHPDPEPFDIPVVRGSSLKPAILATVATLIALTEETE